SSTLTAKPVTQTTKWRQPGVVKAPDSGSSRSCQRDHRAVACIRHLLECRATRVQTLRVGSAPEVPWSTCQVGHCLYARSCHPIVGWETTAYGGRTLLSRKTSGSSTTRSLTAARRRKAG